MVILNHTGVTKFLFFLITGLIVLMSAVLVNHPESGLKTASKQSRQQHKIPLKESLYSQDHASLQSEKTTTNNDGIENKKVNHHVSDAVDDLAEDSKTHSSGAKLANSSEDKPKTNFSNSTFGKEVKNKITSRKSSIIKISNFPVKHGSLSSGFGMRKHPIHGKLRMHSGIDIAAPMGTKVQAMGEGIVVFAGRKSGYGNNIEIKHGNTVLTRYSHLKKILVEVGQKVTPEDVIGLVGSTGVSTGPHLHLEVALNETEVDPTIFLAGKATVAAKLIKSRLTETSGDDRLVSNFDEAIYQDYLQSFDGLYGLVVPGRTN